MRIDQLPPQDVLTSGRVLVEASLVLLSACTTLGDRLLGTAPLPTAVWFFLAPLAGGMFPFEKRRKRLAPGKLTDPLCRGGSRRGPLPGAEPATPEAKGAP